MLQNPTWTAIPIPSSARFDDAALVEGLQRGDARAVEQIVQHHVPHIYRFIYYRVEDATVAEDLVSEVMVRMLTKVGGYVQGSAPFEAWLFRIARNLIADHYRSRQRRPGISLEQWLEAAPLAEPSCTEAGIEVLGDRGMLQEGLAALTAEQRQVILLHVVDGWELPEVAHMLGRTLPSVKSLYYRGVQSLRRILGTRDGQPVLTAA